MHARCDTDPLDFATDVCEQCGGEYCDDHLVHPFGPSRPPLCRSCAIAISGVRPGAAPARRRSRSQIKRRRVELRRENDGRTTVGIELLDPDEVAARARATASGLVAAATADGPVGAGEDRGSEPSGDGTPAVASDLPVPGRGRRGGRRLLPFGRRSSDRAAVPTGDPGAAPEPVGSLAPAARLVGPTPAPTSATLLLARLRETGAVAPVNHPPTAPPNAVQPEAVAGPVAPVSPVRAAVARPRPAPSPPPALDRRAPDPWHPPSPGEGGVRHIAGTGEAAYWNWAPAPPPAPPAPAQAGVVTPSVEDPWADVPPALRGPGSAAGS